MLIVCEGPDDQGFLKQFYRHLKLKDNDIEVRHMGNKSNLLNSGYYKYTTIKDQVDVGLYCKVLFVFDADLKKHDGKCGGYENSQECIKNLIEKLNFQTVAEYYICCDPQTENGNLEQLILSTFDTKESDCVVSFLKCIKKWKPMIIKK